VLCVGERDPGVDLERLAGGVPGVGLDQGVVDALGLEPGEEEVPEAVGADRPGDAGDGGVAGEDLAYAAVAVGLLPGGLEQVAGAGALLGVDVQRERLFEGGGERDVAVLWRPCPG